MVKHLATGLWWAAVATGCSVAVTVSLLLAPAFGLLSRDTGNRILPHLPGIFVGLHLVATAAAALVLWRRRGVPEAGGVVLGGVVFPLVVGLLGLLLSRWFFASVRS
jgi:predicted short-subunit dehydrogenase-like oxidoreductase (DUF2520 family)